MIQTSQKYKQAIVEGSRSSLARIQFGIYDVTAKDDALPLANNTQPFTNINAIVDEVRAPKLKVATFEEDYFTLDGSFYLMPDDINPNDGVGWWSQTMSGADRVFTPYPEITIMFDENHSSLGIGLVFDTLNNEYPECFKVRWYNINTLLHEALIEGNTSPEFIVEHAVENYNKIIIEFIRSSKPYRYARLLEVNFGVEAIFANNNIVSASIFEECDPSSGTLPIGTMRLTAINENQKFNMLNPEGVYAYLQKRQPLECYSSLRLDDGTYETIPLGTYYLSNWRNSNGSTASLEATNIIGVLDGSTYYSSPFWVNEPLPNVIRHVLEDEGHAQFTIDPELNGILINGYIPIVKHRQAIQLILITSRAIAIVERNNVIRFMKPKYDNPVEEVDYTTMIGSPTIEQKKLITSVVASDYSYTPSAIVEQIQELTFILNGTETLVIPYGCAAFDVSLSIQGPGAIQGQVKYSATSAIATIQALGEVKLILSGKKYIENVRVVTASLNNLPAGEVPQVVTISDNKLICGNGMQVAQNVLDYFQHRIKQSFGYWDNPTLQASDCIEVQTMFGQNKSGVIEKHEIIFAPSLKGRIEVTG